MKRGAASDGGRGSLATLVRSRAGWSGAEVFSRAPRRVVVKIGATIPPDGQGWTEQ